MQNILPQDGIAYYYSAIIPSHKADFYYHQLMHQIAWEHDQLVIFGKSITTMRKVAWHGDKQYAYRYSQNTKYARPWQPNLLALKKYVEQISDTSFNTCLLNLYHDGSEGMGWHSDDEKELSPNGVIASLSLGAVRKFSFKHKQTKETISHILEHGSLLIMKGMTQTYWQHALLKTKKIHTPRINLTFSHNHLILNLLHNHLWKHCGSKRQRSYA
ncbi:MAG: alkylated DNA repair dioxygenase AlkB [Alphaproteobacteria bacterium]|jgi:alkylated DNA repair dioxygenase AlkB